MAETLTPEQSKQLEENLLDREWRLANLYYIKDKFGQKVKFQMNAVQRYLLKHFWLISDSFHPQWLQHFCLNRER